MIKAIMAHRFHPDYWVGGQQARCGCGWIGPRHHFDDAPKDAADQEHAEHLAKEINRVLGLRTERAYTSSPIPWLQRGVWEERKVTDWRTVPA